MIFSHEDDAPLALDLAPDWRARLGPLAAALELEIGAGHGGFALAFARAHPDRALVAIEQRRAFAEAVRGKAEQRGHRNLVVILGDGRHPRAAALRGGIARRDPRPLPGPVVEAAAPPAAARGRPDVAPAAAAAAPGRAPRLPHRRRAVRGRGRRAARGDRVRERERAGRLSDAPPDELPSTREKR